MTFALSPCLHCRKETSEAERIGGGREVPGIKLGSVPSWLTGARCLASLKMRPVMPRGLEGAEMLWTELKNRSARMSISQRQPGLGVFLTFPCGSWLRGHSLLFAETLEHTQDTLCLFLWCA